MGRRPPATYNRAREPNISPTTRTLRHNGSRRRRPPARKRHAKPEYPYLPPQARSRRAHARCPAVLLSHRCPACCCAHVSPDYTLAPTREVGPPPQGACPAPPPPSCFL